MPDFQVVFMDAGQGDCTLIVYPDNSLTLVDCGSTKSGDEAFSQILIVLQRFLGHNDNHINNLVLTHPDEDHYNKLALLLDSESSPKPIIDHVHYGGNVDLYRNKKDKTEKDRAAKVKGGNYTFNFLTTMALSGKTTSDATGLKRFSLRRDDSLSRSGVDVTILAANSTGKASTGTPKAKNANSIVLLVTYRTNSIFLMGDASASTEDFIFQKLKEEGALNLLAPLGDRVLKMGHHGSRTSSSPGWVTALRPTILVVSAGTKTFRGTGMPAEDHLKTVADQCHLIETKISQSYVVFVEGNRRKAGLDFQVEPPTKRAVWTTCYNLEYANARWEESGQTWYYGIPLKKKPNWVGYTGFEVIKDVDEEI